MSLTLDRELLWLAGGVDLLLAGAVSALRLREGEAAFPAWTRAVMIEALEPS